MAETANSSGATAETLVDLKKIVIRWAYRFFDKDRTWRQKRIKFKHLDFNIDWDQVHFVHDSPDYEKITGEDDPGAPPAKQDKVLFKTVFKNRTSSPQNYSFKTERKTSSTCYVEVDKGVMKGYEASLTIKTPGEIVSAGAGYKKEVTVNTINSETVVDEMVWAVDSQIQVKGKHKTTAKLIVDEVRLKNTYKVHSVMFGDVKVDIVKKKDKSHVTHVAGDIVEIVNKTMNSTEKATLKVDTSKSMYPHAILSYDTTGRATFRYGAEQRVDLEEESISAESPAED